MLWIDSGQINTDLYRYIQTKVDKLSRRKHYPSKLKQEIQNALSEKAGRTFLWVSLAINDISMTKSISEVRKKLYSLPSSLSEVYSRTLNNIQEQDMEIARFILQWVVTARRPLTVDELAMGCALGPEQWDKDTVPTADTLDNLKDGFKFCMPLLYLDSVTSTIHLAHQSIKDYLMRENLQGEAVHLAYRIIPEKANSGMLGICWRYLSMKEFSRDTMIVKDAARGKIWEVSEQHLQIHCFLRYAIEEWQEHALAASPAVVNDFAWDSDLISRVPILRDKWLQKVAGKGDDAVVKRLLAANADVNAFVVAGDDCRTALQAAAERGHIEVVETLLAANANVNTAGDDGRTALEVAAKGGHLKVVERLLAANADVNAADDDIRTALQAAAGGEHFETIRKLLTATVADDSNTVTESVASVDSVYSVGLSQSSKSSLASLFDDAIQYFVEVLLKDTEFTSLYQEAQAKFSRERLLRNHRRLLKKYYMELGSEARNDQQRRTVRFLRDRRQRNQTTERVDSFSKQSDPVLLEGMSVLSKQKVDRLENVNRLLQSQQCDATENEKVAVSSSSEEAQPVPIQETEGMESEVSSGSDNSMDDYNQHEEYNAAGTLSVPELDRAVEFLTKGVPYSRFKENFRRFIHPPKKLQDALDSGDSKVVQKILARNDNLGTAKEYVWLQEIRELGYTHGEIADLLLGDTNKAPWKYLKQQNPNSLRTVQRIANVYLKQGCDTKVVSKFSRAILSNAENSYDIEDSSSGSISDEEPLSAFARNKTISHVAQDMQIWSRQTATGSPTRQHLRSPQEHHDTTEELKLAIYENSVLALWKVRRQAQSVNDISEIPFPNLASVLNSEWQDFREAALIMKTLEEEDLESTLSNDEIEYLAASQVFVNLMECHNMVYAVYGNLIRLQKARFIDSQSTVLVAEKHSQPRPSVANLLPLYVHEVGALALEARSVLQDVNNLCLDRSNRISRTWFERRFRSISSACDTLLSRLSLSSPDMNHNDMFLSKEHSFREHTLDEIAYFRCTAEVLDLAVLSHTTAHVGLFDYDILGSFQDKMKISSDPASTKLFDVTLQRQSLGCLESLLHGRQVWVFGQGAVLNNMYVSTEVTEFADTWGPMSKVLNIKGKGILQYNVGGGSIIPWSDDKESYPRLKDGERLCHWIPIEGGLQAHILRSDAPGEEGSGTGYSSDSDMEHDLLGYHIDKEQISRWVSFARDNPLTGTERLFIGANDGPRLAWRGCHCDNEVFKQKLMESNALHSLKTARSFRYVDARAFTVGVGSHVTATANVTLKEDKGRRRKDVLLSDWEMQPEMMHPNIFENFWGIAVSMCTMNAQRVRVTELLSTESIENLHASYVWSDDTRDKPSNRQASPSNSTNSEAEISIRKQKFWSAVRSLDPYALGKLWDSHPGWREELGKVLLICLRCLCETGLDSNRDEFSVLWKRPKEDVRKVVLKPSDHNWIRVLNESENSIAMAVLIEDSLRSTRGQGRDRCKRQREWIDTPSMLETALCINHAIKPVKQLTRTEAKCSLKKWRNDSSHDWGLYWDVSKLDKNESFWLSPASCQLMTIQAMSNTHLLLECNTSIGAILRRAFGLGPEKRYGHWEYTEEQDKPPVRPIPVHIRSNGWF